MYHPSSKSPTTISLTFGGQRQSVVVVAAVVDNDDVADVVAVVTFEALLSFSLSKWPELFFARLLITSDPFSFPLITVFGSVFNRLALEADNGLVQHAERVSPLDDCASGFFSDPLARPEDIDFF